MLAVVTGSSGFIGSHLVDRLLRDGHRVRIVTRRGSAARPEVEAYAVDWGSDEATLEAAVAGADVVLHLAGVTRARTDAAFHAGNVAPTIALVRAIRSAPPARRPQLVLVSSQAAAGPASSRERPRVEADVPAPVEGYGRSKLAAERVVRELAGDAPATILRPSVVYGPRDRDVFQLFRLAATGWSVHPGDRDRWIDVVHVDDVVDALLAAAASLPDGSATYFVGGHAVTWRALHEQIAVAVGRSVRTIDLPDWLVRAAGHAGDAWSLASGRVPLASSHKTVLGRQRFWLCSSACARMALGYEPRRALAAGVRETYLWYVEHGWLPQIRSDEHDRDLRPDSDHRPAA